MLTTPFLLATPTSWPNQLKTPVCVWYVLVYVVYCDILYVYMWCVCVFVCVCVC